MARHLVLKLPFLAVVFGCVAMIMSISCYGLASKTETTMLSSDGSTNSGLGQYLEAVTNEWGPAVATWYGAPDGFGTDGGACGYGADVGIPPFSAMVSAGSPSLFLDGKGCGACYQVKCSSKDACSGNPVTVVIIDSCPGCSSAEFHFDLSGTAFGALAVSGQENALRDAGSIEIEYKRVECSYPGTPLTFKVDKGSNPYYFSTVIEYVPGDGEIAQVDLQQTSVSSAWLPMKHSWGSLWALQSDTGSPLQGPFSIRITTPEPQTLVAVNVIPADWVTGETYKDTATN